MISEPVHVIWLPSGEPIALSVGDYERALSRGAKFRGPERNGGTEERFVTSSVLAKILSLPQSWIEEAARQRIIPSVLFGKYRRFNPSDVISAIKRSDANEQ